MTSDADALARPKAVRPDNVPLSRVVDVDMYAPAGIEEGYHEAWKRLQRPGVPDLVWTPYTGGHWIATSGDAIREIFEDSQRFSSEVIFLPKEAGEKYAMVPTKMDPPEHTPYRRVLAKGLGLGQLRKIEATVADVAAELIDGFQPKGGCEFSAEYARIFPVKVFMSLAGLPMSDAPFLGKLANEMTRPSGDTPEEMAQSLDAANKGFFDYVEPIIRARRGGDGDDLISVTVNSNIDDEPIAHDKALGLVSLLLLGGLDTVVNLLSFMMIYLARHPEKVGELREDPGKITRGVEEIFRRFAVVADARMVAQDFEYRGVSLKHGDMVLLPTALHGLDERQTPDPWTLNFDRKPVSHATFGGGPHRCAGAQLARMEVIATLQAWLARIPTFALRADATLAYHSGTVAAVDNVQLTWPAPH